MDTLLDTMGCLSNSPRRLRLLQSLNDDCKSFAELKSELDIPRSSLKRNLSLLEERDWVERSQLGYEATTTGCLILRELQLLGHKVERIKKLEPFLAAVDSPADIDTSRLQNPRVTVPVQDEPYKPSNRLFDALEAGGHTRVFTPVLSSRFLNWFHEAPCDVECIVSSETLERLIECRNSDVFETISEPDEMVLRINRDLPYGLFLSEEHVAFVGYDDRGRIEAVAESEAIEAVDWGKAVYENYREEASPVVGSEVMV